MSDSRNRPIRCPYYIRHETKTCKLACEGLFGEATMQHHFDNGRALRDQLRKFCAGDFAGCPWERVIDMKYGEDNDG